jgi:hypothetical protein
MTIRHSNRPLVAFSLLLCGALLVFSPAVSTQTVGQPENFTASAIDINTGRTGRVDISVARWSTAPERDRLLATLFKKGQDELVRTLQDMRPVGRLYSPGSIGYDLRYSEQRRGPDGERVIVLATDRPMSFWELVNQPRSADYPFTWVQLRMRADGTGEGSLAVAARITGEERERLIEVENYALQPVRLQSVRSRIKA